MLLKMKKFISIMLLTLFAVGSFISTPTVYAEELQLFTKENVASMNKSELLNALQDKGLILPEDYAAHIDMAENFVYKYTLLIMEGKINANSKPFNYSQSNDLLSNLGTVLYNSGLKENAQSYTSRSYTLQNSTRMSRPRQKIFKLFL